MGELQTHYIIGPIHLLLFVVLLAASIIGIRAAWKSAKKKGKENTDEKE